MYKNTHPYKSFTFIYSHLNTKVYCTAISPKSAATHNIPYLKPVNSTTVDQWREHAQSVAKSISNGTHSQDNVQIATDSFDKKVIHRQWTGVYLKVSLLDYALHLKLRNKLKIKLKLENKKTDIDIDIEIGIENWNWN